MSPPRGVLVVYAGVVLIECFFKIKKMSFNLQPQPGQPLSPPHDKPQDFAAPRTPCHAGSHWNKKQEHVLPPILEDTIAPIAQLSPGAATSPSPYTLARCPLFVQRTAMAVGHASQDSARRGLGWTLYILYTVRTRQTHSTQESHTHTSPSATLTRISHGARRLGQFNCQGTVKAVLKCKKQQQFNC